MDIPALVEQALDIFDCELKIIDMELEHPERFAASSVPGAFHSGLRLASKPNNLGIIGIAEIVLGIWLSGEIIGPDGKPAPIIRIAEVFETGFGMSFGDIYDKLEAIFNRKPFNRTKALDYLRTLILRREKEGKI